MLRTSYSPKISTDVCACLRCAQKMLLFSNFVVQLLLVIVSFSLLMTFLLASSGPLQHAREAEVVLIWNKSDLVQHTSPDRRPIIFEHDANAPIAPKLLI